MTMQLCTAVLPEDLSVRCAQPAGHGPLVYMDELETIEADHADVARGAFWSAEDDDAASAVVALAPEMWSTILLALDTLTPRNSAFGEVAALLRSRA
jgi:hypothetical protein